MGTIFMMTSDNDSIWQRTLEGEKKIVLLLF